MAGRRRRRPTAGHWHTAYFFMRFTRHLASRAFSLGARAPHPGRLPAMVPFSALESVREDAKAHAKVLAELNDARFEDAKARIEDAKARIEDAKARIEDVKAHAVREARLVEEVSAGKLATALYERDVARGKVTARALIEEAMAEAWRSWERLDTKGQEQVSATVKKPPSTATDQMKALLGFPGVAAYLRVAEEDNGLARGVLAKSAASLYPALCVPLHARAAGAQVEAGGLPTEVFSAIGENGRIAFAALVAFGGRNVGMYQSTGKTVPVVLRVPPLLGLLATLEQIRGSAKLPAVGATVELGVAGGAEPSGEVVAVV